MSDIPMYRGEAKTIQCAATDAGAVLPLTGAVLYCAVYAEYPAASIISDAGAAIKKTSATPSEITITNAAAGLFEIYLVKADTNTLDLGVYHIGVEAVLSGATSPVVLWVGRLTINPDVVRAV